MRKFFTSPLFRSLVCFLVICCLLIQLTPVGVKATALLPMGYVYSGDVAAGILSSLYEMAMGVVFTDLTYETLVSKGQGFKTALHDYYAGNISAQDVVKVWIEPIQIDLRSPEDIPDDQLRNINLPLLVGDAETVKAAMRNLMEKLMLGSGYEVKTGTAAPDGYAYYNGVLLPTIPVKEDQPMAVLFYNGTVPHVLLSSLAFGISGLPYLGSDKSDHHVCTLLFGKFYLYFYRKNR